MSDATTSAVTEASTAISIIDLGLSLIKIPSIVTRFYLWGYLITFLLGFIGNILSLFTFYRPKLRNISTGCLFILLSISDTVYLLVAVLDFVEYGLQVRLYRRVAYDELCRFRVFTMWAGQLFSAWLLLLITTDRWIRTRFPFKSKSLCTQKKALLAAAIAFIINVGVNSHILLPFFGMALPGIPHVSCLANEISLQYSTFFFYQWSIIQVVLNSFVPAVLMIIMIFNIFFTIRAQKRAVAPHPQPVNAVGEKRQEKRIHNQMFILMLSSAGIFLVTTLPLTINHLIGSHQMDGLAGVEKVLIPMTILNWIQSLNCAVNFYVHCLTSTLFRKEFMQLVRVNRGRDEISMTGLNSKRTIRSTLQHRHN